MGGFLRFDQLAWQVPMEDEWHAVHKALTSGGGEIFWSFGTADHSIPMALYVEWLTRTVGVDELLLRLPTALAGTATVALLPWLAIRRFGPAVAATFAGLLALSPLLIFYSRFARPYGPALLLACLGVFALERWWREGGLAAAASFAIAVALAGWLLPLILPFAMAPLALLLSLAIRAPNRQRPGARIRILALGAATAALLAALVGPPLLSDYATLAAKAVRASLRGATIVSSGVGLLGGSIFLAALFGALALWGLRRVPAQARLLVALFGSGVLLQAAVLLAARPLGIEAPHILARYLLPVAPVALLLAALGLATVAAAVSARNTILGPLLIAVVLALTYLGGPLRGWHSRPNAWLATDLLFATFMGLPTYNQSLMRTPRFYAELATLPPGSVVLAEAPATRFLWANPLPLHQRRHRQHVRLADTFGLCSPTWSVGTPLDAPGADFQSVLQLVEPGTLRRARVEYVVFHTDLFAETTLGAPAPEAVAATRQLEPCLAAARRRFGAPAFADADIVVFDLTGAKGP